MIRAEFYGDRKGFLISGHSGYAGHGEDIVCAAVTSAVRLCDAVIRDSFGVPAEVSADDSLAEISFRLLADDERAVGVVRGLRIYLSQLSEEYPDFIKVLEVTRNA